MKYLTVGDFEPHPEWTEYYRKYKQWCSDVADLEIKLFNLKFDRPKEPTVDINLLKTKNTID